MQVAIPLYRSKIGKLTKLQGAKSVPEGVFTFYGCEKWKNKKTAELFSAVGFQKIRIKL